MIKSRSRRIGLILALALTFNALLPFFAFYQNVGDPPSVASSATASIFGDKILICTGEGFAWVKWTDLFTGKIPFKQHKTYVCALCYIAANAIGKILLLATAVIFLTRKRAAGLSLSFLYNTFFASLSRTVSHPRAPPVSFCF